MKKRILCKGIFLLIAILSWSISSNAQCNYTLSLDDTFGDGWNGNTIDVTVGTVTTNYTLNAGTNTIVNLLVNTGDSIILDYLGGGGFNNEVSFTLQDPSGTSVYASGTNPFTGVHARVAANCPSCSPPINFNVTSLTDISAQLNWTELSSATQWEVEYDTAGFTLGTGNTVLVSVDTFLMVTGLTALTNYDWYIRTICAPMDSSSFAGANSFTTNCAAFPAPFVEEFTTFLPNVCWEEADDGTPATGPMNFGAGSWNNNFGNTNGAFRSNIFTTGKSDWILSPTIDFGAGGYELAITVLGYDFGAAPGTFSGMGSDDTVSVVISDNGGLTWTIVHTWDITNPPSANPVIETVNLTTYTGSNNIIGLWVSEGVNNDPEDYWFEVEEFELRIPPTCPAPTVNTVGILTDSSAVLTWVENGTATEWEVEWDTAGYTVGTARNSMLVVNDTFLTVTSLMAQTNYDWNVRAICGPMDTSTYVDGSFLTLCSSFPAPFTENFTNFVPLCWDQADDGIVATGPMTFGSSSWNNNGGNANGAFRSNLFTTGKSDWAISPIIDLGAGGYELAITVLGYDFGAAPGIFSGMGSDDTVQVVVSNDGGLTWKAEYTWDAANPPPSTAASQRVDLTNFTGSNHLIAIYATEGVIDDTEDYYFEVEQFELRIPPLCPAPSMQGIDSLLSTGATLTWVENGMAAEWEVQYDTAGFPLGTGTSAFVITDTFLVVTGLTANTNYDWYVRAICGRGDTSTWIGASSFFTGHCVPAPSSTDGNGITNVSFSTVNNSGPIEPNFYGDYSALVGNIQQSTTVNVDITFETGFTYDTQIWIDWNDDLDFDDIGENVYTGVSLANNPTTLNASFMVPATAPLGQHRMRIGGIDFGNLDPCYTGAFGSFEDYTVNVLVPPTCVVPSMLALDSLATTGATFTWLENGTATQWEVEYDTAGFTLGTGTSTLVNTDTFLVVNGLTPNTNYTWYVRAICGPGDTSLFVSSSFFTGYCTPAPSSTDNNGITNVTFSSVNNTGPIEPNFYGDYSALVGNVQQTTLVNVDITYETGFTYGTRIWVDWNDDLDFDDVGEEVYFGLSGAANPTVLNASFMVPFTAPLGQHRMRIGGSDNNAGPDPCYTGAFGSFEDYTINVIVPPTCPQPMANAATAISADSATISWVEIGMATQWEVQYDVAGFTLGSGMSTIVNTDTFVVVNGLSQLTTYDYYIRAICSATDTSTWTQVSSFTTTCPGISIPAALPFIEGWESNSGILMNNNTVLCDPAYTWEFTTTSPEGRVSFGTNAADVSTGLGAVTLDRDPSGVITVNDLILTIDLSNYTMSTDLELLFDYRHHGEENHDNDSVWIRASNTDPWIGMYDLFANQATTFTTVGPLDIDDSLTAAGQTVSSTFQVRFGQEDNFPVPSDGYTFDNITIRETLPVFYPIGTINTEDAMGVADSLGVNCAISGTVVGVDKRGGGYDFVLIDMSSGSQEGITVFAFNDLANYTTPTEGDSLLITGNVSQFRGLTQFSPSSIAVISSGNAIPAPIVTTTLDESTESKWLSIPTRYVSLGTSGTGSFNLDLTNGTDTITIRVDSDTDIDDSLAVNMPIVPGDTICGLFGTGGQFNNPNAAPFNNGYQIFPMRWSDLTICRLAVGIDDVDAVNNAFSINPNPTTGQFVIETTGFDNASVIITVRDLEGRIVRSEAINNANSPLTKSFDLTDNAKGVYFITIQDGESLINQKLVIQ